MKQIQGKRSLEAYRIFPYIAWSLVVGFSLFVYSIVIELQDTTKQLAWQTNSLEAQISAGPQVDVEAFENSRYRPDRSE